MSSSLVGATSVLLTLHLGPVAGGVRVRPCHRCLIEGVWLRAFDALRAAGIVTLFTNMSDYVGLNRIKSD